MSQSVVGAVVVERHRRGLAEIVHPDPIAQPDRRGSLGVVVLEVIGTCPPAALIASIAFRCRSAVRAQSPSPMQPTVNPARRDRRL